MKKLITLLCLGFILSIVTVVAQPYPDFNVTAYDSVQSNGYYFFCPYVLRAYPNLPSGTQRQMILDKKWKVVYFRNISGFFAGDFKLHPNGLMSYAGISAFYIMDSTFTMIDSVTTGNGIYYDIHDLQILSNGHYLLLGMQDSIMDLSSYSIF